MDEINKAFNYIKENLSVIILIPTVLGGFWQLIELVCLEIGFIRFFSVTQVISDGLLILCIGALSGLAYYLLFIKLFNLPIFNFKKKDNNENQTKEELEIVKPLGSTFIKIGICLLVMALMYFNGNLTTFKKGILIYLSISLISFIIDIIRIKLLKNYRYSRTAIFLTLFIPMLLIQFNTIIQSFHKLFLPQKINNVKYIECYVGKKKNEFELLYFNDKYIFVQIKKTQEIEIINFEELFKKDNCK